MNTLLLIITIFINLNSKATELTFENPEPPSHVIFDDLLKKHVSNTGLVDYRGFIKDKHLLDQYCNLLGENPPDRNTWTYDEQLVFWINTYNAFTIKLIVENFPVKSITDLHPKNKSASVNTVWQLKFFQIGNRKFSLDEIENEILRKDFEEPRIHFAINCASSSCPPLLNEAFLASKIDSQLDKVTKNFINDSRWNKINHQRVEISQVFSWYLDDFSKKGSIIDYLNIYSQRKIDPKAKVSYLDYDWSLNEKK